MTLEVSVIVVASRCCDPDEGEEETTVGSLLILTV